MDLFCKVFAPPSVQWITVRGSGIARRCARGVRSARGGGLEAQLAGVTQLCARCALQAGGGPWDVVPPASAAHSKWVQLKPGFLCVPWKSDPALLRKKVYSRKRW